MNAQRLVTLANLVHEEVRSSHLVKVLRDLTTKVQEAINSPNENTQRAVETVFSQLTSTLQSAATNRLSPGLRGDLAELKIDDVATTRLVGAGLLQQLQEVFENGYTSVQTLDRLRKLQEQVASLDTGLQSLTQGLSGLGLQAEDVPSGEAVAGMTVPRIEVRDGMRQLINELTFFDQFILQLSECVDGQANDPQVVTLRSSNFGVDVSASLDVVAALALIIKGVKAALNKLAKFRKLKEDSEELGVEAVVEEVTRKSKESLEATIEEIEAEVFQSCKLNDEGRVNELRTALKFKINGLANRMERGFTFEVRSTLPPAADQKAVGMHQAVTSISEMSFEPIEGPRLLSLPEAPEEEPASNGDGAEKKPKRRGTKIT